MNKKTLEQVSIRTGLSVAACTDMLNGGWTYVEKLNGEMQWERPIDQHKEFYVR